ncbi:MAG TPA: hypothetical protein VKH83_08495 [Methylomirabilota bacterium]|nr:hypothetical protein [Methylomirabilota bacterium]
MLLTLVLLLLVSLARPAQAGHELPFYPGYYPQEIRLETLTPAAAAAQLRNSTLHAYIGADPFAGGRLPSNVTAIESLQGYLVATLSPSAPQEWRCATAQRIARRLGASRAGFGAHPYPVTPHHADYLQHFDLAQAAKKAVEAVQIGAPVRVSPRGVVAERLLAQSKEKADPKEPGATLEEVDLRSLLAAQGIGVGEFFGPPWVKEGWFHAYHLLSPSMADAAARQAADDLYRRLRTGAYDGAGERAELERRLVSRLTSGCERAVLGYTLRREPFNSEFSQGVENIGWDSQTGFDSEIFVRTVKLKDFPWNGWLRLATGSRPAAAWNPVAGFSDPAGRLIWAAVGDPALLPAPYAASVVPHRAVPAGAQVAGPAGMEIPEDALLPEPGTGLLQPVGKGKTARARVTYRLWGSAAHDNTRVTPADALYPYSFAARWGTRRAGAGDYDPAVDAATAVSRQALAAVRLVGVESEVRRYSDITFTYVIPVIEVYLKTGATDPQELAALAPPWSTVPWHVTALMEEAVRRGVGAFSSAEAKRRGVRWLDLARDARTREELGHVLDRLASGNYIPEPLRRLVDADEAQTRWAALRQFAQRRGHYLVTNGPYQLEKWTDGAVVLQVFRDMNNPLGVGTYDRFAIPRRAYVSRIAARSDRLEVSAEIERTEKFLRDFRLVREPLGSPDEDKADVPVCRYVILGADGAVATAGVSREVQGSRLIVDLKGRLKPGSYTALVALALGDNLVGPEVATAQFRVDGAP